MLLSACLFRQFRRLREVEKISGVAGRYWLRCARGGPMKVGHVAYGKAGTNLTLKLL